MSRLQVVSKVMVEVDADPSQVLGNALDRRENVAVSKPKERGSDNDQAQGHGSGLENVTVKKPKEARRGNDAEVHGSGLDSGAISRSKEVSRFRGEEVDTPTQWENRLLQTQATAAILSHTIDENKVRSMMDISHERIRVLEDELLRLRLAIESEHAENARLKDDLGRKNRDIAALTLHVDTLSQHLEEARASDATAFLSTRKDSVVETEALKGRLSRAERERDALMFQIQEVERRSRLEREEEAALREETAARAAEHERRAAYAELQRVRAEADAGSLRQQTEHWRAAARSAQDEVAALRTQLELPRIQDVRISSGTPSSAKTDKTIASELAKRQLQAKASSPSNHPPVNGAKEADAARQRLAQIAADIARLDDIMENNFGTAVGRTPTQRLQREQLRKQIDELNREASRIKAEFLKS